MTSWTVGTSHWWNLMISDKYVYNTSKLNSLLHWSFSSRVFRGMICHEDARHASPHITRPVHSWVILSWVSLPRTYIANRVSAECLSSVHVMSDTRCSAGGCTEDLGDFHEKKFDRERCLHFTKSLQKWSLHHSPQSAVVSSSKLQARFMRFVASSPCHSEAFADSVFC